uniref:SOSEKI DIX-like domain-containing protein n=1 Tax=Aegilops tauschii TaxID=37682 RepID=M8B2P0_AEGTA
MEAAGEGRKLHHHAGGGRAQMEASPERGRPAYASAVTARSAPARPMRRVQIIYYLCRNGQLEHPHFMELAQHPHQPLRLKDVMDKLTLLRGKGMPALFSWSCKRNYKNGYVWNDLSESDVIYPSDGVEYVLKGSEIFPGCSSAVAADRFQHLRVTDRSPTKPPLALPHSHKQYVDAYRDDAGEDPEDDELGGSRLGVGAIGEETADERIGGGEGMMRGRQDKEYSIILKPANMFLSRDWMINSKKGCYDNLNEPMRRSGLGKHGNGSRRLNSVVTGPPE